MNPAQLFNPSDRSFTYVVFDEKTREAVVIDPVSEEFARDVSTLRRMNVRPVWVLSTSGLPHAVAAAQQLATEFKAQVWQQPDAPTEAQTLALGQTKLQVLHTPGVSPRAVSLYWAQMIEAEKLTAQGGTLERTGRRHVFTGLTLLIGSPTVLGAEGNAQTLHQSVHQQLFTLPGVTILWPGRDDHQRSQSTVALEKSMNSAFFAAPAPASAPLAATATQSQAMPEAAPEVRAADGYAGDVPPTLAHAWVQAGDAVLVDVRTDAERAWVGQVPGALPIAWKQWPGMAENPLFDATLRHEVPEGKKVLMLCRSGVRSIAAARRAAELGLEAYNVLEGFEGDLDGQGHRGQLGGWRRRGLPWIQG